MERKESKKDRWRECVRESEKERESSSTSYQLVSQLAMVVIFGPAWCYKPVTPSPSFTSSHALDPPSAAFSDIFAGNWLNSRVAKTQSSVPLMKCWSFLGQFTGCSTVSGTFCDIHGSGWLRRHSSQDSHLILQNQQWFCNINAVIFIGHTNIFLNDYLSDRFSWYVRGI